MQHRNDTPARPSNRTNPIDVFRPAKRGRHCLVETRGGSARLRLIAASAAAALMGVTAIAAAPAAAVGGATPAPAVADRTDERVGTAVRAAADRITVDLVAAAEQRPRIVGDPSVAQASVRGGTQVTVAGDDLTEVASVTVDGVEAPIVAADDASLTFEVPAVSDERTGAAELAFVDVDGEPVVAEAAPEPEPVDSAPAIAGTASLAGITASSKPAPKPEPETRTLAIDYAPDAGVQAQIDYVLRHWNDYNTAEFMVLSGYDCANFASQSLLARGWQQDDGWYYNGGATSPSWVSSTAMRDYLLSRPDRATPLDDSQRDQVRVGDIAQFDWDASGDRDHTAVVTRVEHGDGYTKVWVGGHTKDADYWDVDEALASGGGTVSYFSIK